MKRFRLLIAAAVFGFVATACSSDVLGPTPGPSNPSFDSSSSSSGQGGFGSGG